MQIRLLAFLTTLFFFSQSVAQKAKLAQANKNYDSFSYIDAIEIYEKVAQKGYQSVELFQRLGDSYYFNSEFQKSVTAYEKLFQLNPETLPEYYFRYAQSLKSVGDYVKSDEYMRLFAEKSNKDQRARLFTQNTNYLDQIKRNSGRFNITDAGVNSSFSDYGSAFIGDQLVFTTARDTGGAFSRKMKWNNQAFTNLYGSTVKVDGSMTKPEKFTKILNTKFNESSAVFTKDGKTMYFTRNNYTDGKKGKDKDKKLLLKLYRATFDEIEWINVEELPFNSDEYSCAHPALSPDDRTLYFASDMPGSFGQSDLYKVQVYFSGDFGKPKNLGAKINSEGKETFPFVSDENELYFASDGRPGLGGLDVFVTKMTADGSFGDIENLGEPLNSTADDFAFMIDSKSRNGFFSSNREGGMGSDDIYRFTETRKITCEQLLSGNVTDEETGDFLPNAQVILFDANFNRLAEMYANDFGYFSFPVECKKTYYLRANKVKFETKEINITVPDEYGKTTANITLGKISKTYAKGDDVAIKLGLSPILFDLGKSNIRPDAALELEKVFLLMRQNPNLKLDIRSHTDSRESKKYNLKLSNARAKSTIKWLVFRGISPDRLTGNGYGESQLLNECADGVDCTEEQHQKNRRSQFIVVEK